MKKKLFKKFVLFTVIYFVFVMIANLFICMGMTSLIRQDNDQFYIYAMKIMNNSLHNNGTKVEDELKEQETINELSFFANLFTSNTPLWASKFGIYRCDTKELIAGSDDNYYLVENDKTQSEDTRYQYYCKIQNRDELKAYTEKYGMYPALYFEVTEIYRKGLDCYVSEAVCKYGEKDDDLKEDIFRLDETKRQELSDDGYVVATESDSLRILGPEPVMTSGAGVLFPDYNAKVKAINDSLYGYNLEIDGYSSEMIDNRLFYFAENSSSKLTFGRPFYDQDGNMCYVYTCYTYDVQQVTIKAVIISFIFLQTLNLIIAFFVYKMDMQKKESERASQEYRKKLMDAMAHDLKSPLTVIAGYAESLKANVNTDKHDHYTDAIIENVNSMNRTIENILKLSELDQLKRMESSREVSMKELFQTVFSEYEVLLNKKGLSYDIDGDLTMKADEKWMKKAVENLVRNAILYARSESQIKVKLTKTELQIQNEMEKKLADDIVQNPNQLLDPFVRGDAARGDDRGNGLGLAIVGDVARAHKMKADIQIEADIFTVVLSLGTNAKQKQKNRK